MSEFIKSLQAERARLLPLADPVDLPAALERRKLARDEYEASIQARDRFGVNSTTVQDHELNEAATAANQVVADLERAQERARERIKEIDRLLTAGRDADRARKDLAKASAGIKEARTRIDELDRAALTAEGEIAEFTRQRANAIAKHGRDELNARLAGKPAVPHSGLAELDAKLEGSRAVLEAAREAKAEIDGTVASFTAEAKGARSRLRGALQRAAELSYYELLPTVLPVVARMMALGSPICGNSSLEIYCDDETLQTAHDALREEIDAV